MKSKSDATLFYKKPPATPNFCKPKVSRINHIQMLNLLTFGLTIGRQHLGQKKCVIQSFKKSKYILGINMMLGNFYDQKKP